MQNNPNIYATFELLKKVWSLFLIAIYFACFMNEYYFPGFREEPLEGEAIYWKIQRLLFFGLMGLGFLTDVVQMRLDREKAYYYLFMSLILGGLSGIVGAYQYRFFATMFGATEAGNGEEI
tara:strand:- start:1378 stop:1740 length:363 start_codon:yes stop_codon:yes gene_type:complete